MGAKYENVHANNTERKHGFATIMQNVLGKQRMDNRIRGGQRWIQTLPNQIGI